MWWSITLTEQQRHALTRVLCLLVLVGSAIFVASWVVAAIMFMGVLRGFSSTLPTSLVPVIIAAVLLGWPAGFALFAWRACDACRFHLYNFWDTRWLWVDEVTRLHDAARAPHLNTERFLGSIGYGTIWRKAVSGVAHCPWCGHADRENNPV